VSETRLRTALSRDLTRLWSAISRHRYQIATAVGPEGRELRRILLRRMPGELHEAGLLYRTVARLGGAPTVNSGTADGTGCTRDIVAAYAEEESREHRIYRQHARLAVRERQDALHRTLSDLADVHGDFAEDMVRLLRQFTDDAAERHREPEEGDTVAWKPGHFVVPHAVTPGS